MVHLHCIAYFSVPKRLCPQKGGVWKRQISCFSFWKPSSSGDMRSLRLISGNRIDAVQFLKQEQFLLSPFNLWFRRSSSRKTLSRFGGKHWKHASCKKALFSLCLQYMVQGRLLLSPRKYLCSFNIAKNVLFFPAFFLGKTEQLHNFGWYLPVTFSLRLNFLNNL